MSPPPASLGIVALLGGMPAAVWPGMGWAATAPTALVESVSAPVPGVTPLGYLAAGATLDLGSGTVLVLDYLSQCVRETITGGHVTIGADQSQMTGGHLSRRRLDCDGGDLEVAASLSEQGAVAEYRGIGDAPSLVLRSTAPMILPNAAGQLVIERLDHAEAPIRLSVAPGGGRTLLDLAAQARMLTKGATYRATLGKHSLVFSVDPAAGGTGAPLLARMLPL
jgi:hypothetical protein